LIRWNIQALTAPDRVKIITENGLLRSIQAMYKQQVNSSLNLECEIFHKKIDDWTDTGPIRLAFPVLIL